ncbi:MAG TPA: DcaP family trimeric outer membrane transporter [Woeseiaceae bacterium]|nr:DcaP family trimeric outer membrane transporter [Woeseiaceae bacterium]
MIRVTPKLCASAAAFMLCVSGSAVAQDDGPTTTYKFGGYAKFDAMFTDYSDATPDGNSLMRQFYYAPQVPVGDGSASDDITADFQARETRINFTAATTTPGGDSITAFIEMDFFTHTDGNEVVSNSYSPRLRHAFIKYNKWTFGQTWSTFQDVVALPEALDFVGPAESTTFIRQAMVRYTTGNLELAAENPETFVTGGTRGLSTMPDLIGRYTFKLGDKGSYVKVAGIYRSLKIQDLGGSQADETGYGISASTKLMFGNGADFRAMVTYGDGVGRYIGLGFVPDGYVDVNNSIATAEALAYFAAVRVPLGKNWRTNLMYGNTTIDYDDDVAAATLNDTGWSFHANLIYNILPKLDVGAEIIYGERELVNGTDGDFTRFMFSAKYAF